MNLQQQREAVRRRRLVSRGVQQMRQRHLDEIRLGIVASLLLVLAPTAWALDLAAVSTGFHDADGFVDCNRACSGTHHVAAVGFLLPPLVISLSAVGLLVVALRRRGRLLE